MCCSCGVKVLVICEVQERGVLAAHSQVIQSIHDQLLHPFHSIVEFFVTCILPNVAIPHLLCDEHEKVVDDLDLVVDSERSFGKVAQKSVTL